MPLSGFKMQTAGAMVSQCDSLAHVTRTMSLEQGWLEDLVVVGPRPVTWSSSYSMTAVYLLWVLAGTFERLACLASAA